MVGDYTAQSCSTETLPRYGNKVHLRDKGTSQFIRKKRQTHSNSKSTQKRDACRLKRERETRCVYFNKIVIETIIFYLLHGHVFHGYIIVKHLLRLLGVLQNMYYWKEETKEQKNVSYVLRFDICRLIYNTEDNHWQKLSHLYPCLIERW